MTESYPGAERTPKPPRFETEITYPTAFALEEYMKDQQVGLTQATMDMANTGLTIAGLKLDGCVVEIHYPNGEQWYVAPEEMDLELVDFVSKLSISLPQGLQDSIRLMAMRCEVSAEEMFAGLIEEARTLRIARKRGGNLICVHPDRRRQRIVLIQEKDD
jgi:hypothetical protein